MVIKLGKQITRLRKEKGMTQEQLAPAVGVSPPAVSKWETDFSEAVGRLRRDIEKSSGQESVI